MLFVIFNLDVKHWKLKTDLDIKDAVNEFKKSIDCPDPENCKAEPSDEICLNFPKMNDNVYQNTNLSNKLTIHKNHYTNEISYSKN